MQRRLIRFSVGSAVGVLCIVLLICFPAHELAVQVAVWSLIVMAILIAESYSHFREKWFWKTWLLVIMLHVAIVASFWHSLPFSTLGVAMLMSFAEVTVFLFVFRMMEESS